MNKIRIFCSYNNATKLLFLEAFICLAWARILKSLPFSRIAPLLGNQMDETPMFSPEENSKLLTNISNAVNITSRYTIWESMCLVRAIAALKMLERRNIDCTLYLGTGKDENGKLIAHAWLRSGSYYLTGFEGMEKFTVVGSFAKKFGNDIQGEYYGNGS